MKFKIWKSLKNDENKKLIGFHKKKFINIKLKQFNHQIFNFIFERLKPKCVLDCGQGVSEKQSVLEEFCQTGLLCY